MRFILCTTALFSLSILGCQSKTISRNSTTFFIPTGYIGWIRIDYGVKGASPLQNKQGSLIHQIPSGGYLKTSSAFEEGYSSDQFYYTGSQGKKFIGNNKDGKGMVWLDSIVFPVSDEKKLTTSRIFFVGSQAQMNYMKRFSTSIGAIDATALKFRMSGKDWGYMDLSGHNLSKRSFVGANVSNVLWDKSNLQDADFSYAIMQTNFIKSNLRNSNLSNTILINANLSGADLRGANLQRAQLQGANLRFALMDGTDLKGAQYDSNTVWPTGVWPKKRGARLHPLLGETK